jgi:hypothetical protein
MDVLTFHTLMMGHTKRLNHSRVLQLYDEALAANIEVSVHRVGQGSSRPESVQNPLERSSPAVHARVGVDSICALFFLLMFFKLNVCACCVISWTAVCTPLQCWPPTTRSSILRYPS